MQDSPLARRHGSLSDRLDDSSIEFLGFWCPAREEATLSRGSGRVAAAVGDDRLLKSLGMFLSNPGSFWSVRAAGQIGHKLGHERVCGWLGVRRTIVSHAAINHSNAQQLEIGARPCGSWYKQSRMPLTHGKVLGGPNSRRAEPCT